MSKQTVFDKIDSLIMGQSMKDEVKHIFEEHENKKPVIVFENVGSNIIHSRITGEPELLDLTLKITDENQKQCIIAYGNNHKLRVIVEVIK